MFFSPLSKLAGRAIYFACVNCFFFIFTGLVGIFVGMIILIFVWRSPKWRCYGNQLNLGDDRRHPQKRPLFFALAFDNGLANHKSTFKRLNGSNPATSCTNFVNFSVIFWEFMLLKRAIFAAIRPHSHSRSHSEMYWKIAILISSWKIEKS